MSCTGLCLFQTCRPDGGTPGGAGHHRDHGLWSRVHAGSQDTCGHVHSDVSILCWLVRQNPGKLKDRQTHTPCVSPSNTIMTMTSILTCAGEDDPHQPGPAQSESDLHQEGASGVSVGRNGPSAQTHGCVCWSCSISEDLLLLQRVRHRHPVELPLDDAGLEECCLSRCWKHPGP